jgi:hypothetical protein
MMPEEAHRTKAHPMATSETRRRQKPQLHKITLHLARDHGFPEGSRHHGYEIVAPLDGAGRIDAAAWRKARPLCRIRRFWGGLDETGHLVHTRGGAWAFHYDQAESPADDEVGYRVDSHVFEIGQYVSIREQDGDVKTFRVVSVEDIDDPNTGSETGGSPVTPGVSRI